MLRPMSPTDSMFLLGESREHPMHVGGLVLFDPPEGGDATDVREMLDDALARNWVAPHLRRRPRRSLTTLGQWAWEEDAEIDLAHHVQHDALPQPGGIAELMDLVSRLHAGLLDRSRPLWEMHLIEGLADGRFAVYMKIHHSLTDGVSAMRLLRSALSGDESARGMAAPWEPRAPKLGLAAVGSTVGAVDLAGAAIRAAREVAGDVVGILPALADTVDRAIHGRGGSLSLASPSSLFNVPIGGARRFAAGSWQLERLRLVAKHADASINDVVLAMCSGALREFLAEGDALPAQPLHALVPVSLRQPSDGSSGEESRGGNRIGVLTCNLGTDLDDAGRRLSAVSASMAEGKETMVARSATQIRAMSALGVAPLAMGMVLGRHSPVRPANVMISNVPGPRGPLYWNGARMAALYPLSIPVDGQALNITCTSTDDEIAFGLTGCRRSVPDLAPLVGHLDDELGRLEEAVGL
ncbi:wax ester/triacylglycerol synthase family O-acyltransferase [Rhodococcus sp. NPDC003318]|uniref:WS/DGAT/MGAT family O-acyltransferase n=1 Tax=Rhodococcus sp. NPDC003318 TaxID=3364503 RepID=UPI0036A4ADAE